jgi:hypothetical protein
MYWKMKYMYSKTNWLNFNFYENFSIYSTCDSTYFEVSEKFDNYHFTNGVFQGVDHK